MLILRFKKILMKTLDRFCFLILRVFFYRVVQWTLRCGITGHENCINNTQINKNNSRYHNHTVLLLSTNVQSNKQCYFYKFLYGETKHNTHLLSYPSIVVNVAACKKAKKKQSSFFHLLLQKNSLCMPCVQPLRVFFFSKKPQTGIPLPLEKILLFFLLLLLCCLRRFNFSLHSEASLFTRAVCVLCGKNKRGKTPNTSIIYLA